MPELEAPACLGLLGERATVVPETLLPRASFLSHFAESVEAARTRDEVREGFVITDGDGVLHKYKSTTWGIWEKKKIVSQRNVLKALLLKSSLQTISESSSLETCEECALKQGFSHLTGDGSEWLAQRGQSAIVESETRKLRDTIREIVEAAKAHWAAHVAEAAVQTVTAVVEERGGERVVTMRDLGKAFGKNRTVHFFKPLLGQGDDVGLEDFIARIREQGDIGALLAAWAAAGGGA